MKRNVWVVHHKEKWGVRMEGDTQDLQTFETQQVAIDTAREIAKRDKVELIVQGRDGAIREKLSYGHDPRSVKG